ncbi:hypothetical protein tf_55 [Pseudomonas phage tf]|uniref:Uncharacterized protein n=1 Tax=Pseudomonas phage tf TaxID=1114179 RepID=J7SBP6_9CAUD|nr:hypothetical protein tf_55 [Pseudomonas phage tf]CCL97945.1 hypothetical protein tf_55 [Pseudomonas phage tf]
MITLISNQNILELFPKMVSGLERAFQNTSIGSYWNMKLLVDHLVNREVYGFFEPESGYSGIFQFTYSPLAKTLNFFWSGKDPSNTTPVNWDLIDTFLTAIAQAEGCKFITCEGRPGWKKILESRGYTTDSVLFTKEVSHESPPV